MTEQPREGWLARLRRGTSRVVALVQAVADADPEQIEATARRLGSSRRYLAPVAWVAGMLVLVVRGIKLLLTNWRLLALEAIPATWVWMTMWFLRHGDRQAPPLHDLSLVGVVLGLAAVSAVSSVALWCNCVFGFAISQSPVSVRPAIRHTWPFRRRLMAGGVLVGGGVAVGFAVIPDIHSFWLYAGAVWAMYGVLLSALVVVPVWVIGIARHRFGPVETVQRWVTGWALAAVAMAPGFLVARFGILLINVSRLDVLGSVVLTLGVLLYAAGLSSVKAVTLSMKLEVPDQDRDLV